MREKAILAIGAHPDDIEFGCAGTLINHTRMGNRVELLIMTQGGQGGEKQIRRSEQEASARIMGIHHIHWGDYDDTRLPADKECIGRIEDVIKEVKPDCILSPFPDDTHQDHRNLSQATMSATRYVKNVLFFEGPTTQNFTPKVFSDINESLDKKMEALSAHQSQVNKTNIQDMSILDLARSSANFRGIQGRVKYAEAFYALRLFFNL